MKQFRGMRREVGHGGIVPHGWQMAWYEPRRRLGIYYPAPLNLVLRAWREIRYRVLAAIHAPAIECTQVFEMQRTHRERERLAEEYASGYLVGWRECFQACLEVVEDEIAGADASGASCDLRTWLPIDVKPRQEN